MRFMYAECFDCKKLILWNLCELTYISYQIEDIFDCRKLNDVRVELLRLNFKTTFVCRA